MYIPTAKLDEHAVPQERRKGKERQDLSLIDKKRIKGK